MSKRKEKDTKKLFRVPVVKVQSIIKKYQKCNIVKTLKGHGQKSAVLP